MGIIVNLGEEKSDLQKRIAADLREKSEEKSAGGGKKKLVKDDFAKPEFSVDDSAYMKDFAKKKLPASLTFLIGIFVVVAVVVGIMFIAGGGK